MTWKGRVLLYLSLIANVVAFFHKPLFSKSYTFPWDFQAVQVPLVSFLSTELSHGRFALWDPFTYCGVPVVANIEGAFFHPLVFAAALFSAFTSPENVAQSLEWVVVTQICIAGVCTFHVFRNLGLSSAAAWVGSIVFETGGFFASGTEHIGSVMAACWMPLSLFAVLKLRERPSRYFWTGVLAIALALSVLGGLPQSTLGVYLFTLLFAAGLVLLKIAPAGIFPRAVCGMALGLASAAVILLPAAQLTFHSVARYRADWLGSGGGMFWQSFVSLVWPNAYHIFDLQNFKGPWDPTFLYLYVSALGFVFVLVALVFSRTRQTLLFALAALFAGWFMLGDKTWLWRATYPHLPESIRIGIHPEYTYFIFSFSLAGLAACGLDRFRLPEPAKWAAGAAMALDLFLVGSNRPMNCSYTPFGADVTVSSFNHSSPLLREVRKLSSANIPPWRIDNMSDASIDWAQAAILTGVPSAGGDDPLAPENVIQLRLLLHDGFRWGFYYPLEKPDAPILDAMNVKYVLAGQDGARRLASDPKYEHVTSLPGTEVFSNRSVLPRFYIVSQVSRVSSADQARRLLSKNEVDLRDTALVYDPVNLVAPREPGNSNVTVLSYLPNSLDLEVNTPSEALLVLSEAFYPGWRAWIDAQEVPIHETNVAFRGVVLPGGRHHVRMQFFPVILIVGAGISLLALTTVAFLMITGRRRTRYLPGFNR